MRHDDWRAMRNAFGSGNGTSPEKCIFYAEDAYGKMRGEPDRAEKKDNAEEKFGGDGDGTMERRWYRRDIDGCADQVNMARESCYDQDGGYDGSEDSFHGAKLQ